MASYQDIYVRLNQVERMLDFVMSNARMKAAISSDVLDGNGRPITKVFEGSLKELYYLSQQLPVIDQPPVVEENENVADSN